MVTRQCLGNGSWGSISGIQNCYSIEFSALLGSTIDLKNFYFGYDDSNDVYDQSQSYTLLDSLSVSRELRSLTNSSNPIAPTDLNVANDIIRAIIRYVLCVLSYIVTLYAILYGTVPSYTKPVLII